MMRRLGSRVPRSGRPARRCARGGQRGMTLIEAIVALALVAVAVVALVLDLDAAQKSTTIAQNQASADAQLRYVSDYLRGHSTSAYVLCAGTATYSIPNPPSGPALNPSNPVTAITLSKSATRNGSPISPLKDCKTGTVSPATCPVASSPPGCDYGVQEITITQTVGSTSLTRSVWKSVP